MIPQRSAKALLAGQQKCPTFLFLLLLFTLAFSDTEFAKSGSPAGEITFDLDRAASVIEFSVGATLHTVRGTFKLKQGSVLRCDVGSGEVRGRIVVDVRSGSTGNDERDRRMHQEVLQSAQFPEAIFAPERLEGKLSPAGESKVNVSGVLRVHGEDHEVTLPARVSVANGHFAATSHLTIPYVRWGMKDPSSAILRVSKTVELEIRLVGSVRQGKGSDRS